MKTYLTLYQNEQRAAELEIRDQDDEAFVPTSAYAKIVDADGTTVVSETEALITSNTIVTLITSEVTATIGDYEIIWRILKTVDDITYTYYHKTQFTVEEL